MKDLDHEEWAADEKKRKASRRRDKESKAPVPSSRGAGDGARAKKSAQEEDGDQKTNGRWYGTNGQ